MPGYMDNPTLPGRYEGEHSGDLTPEECKEKWPDHAHLSNQRYAQLMGDYLACTTVYLHQFPFTQDLEKQLGRRDLDTVCAYELY